MKKLKDTLNYKNYKNYKMKHLILLAFASLCIFPATYAQENKTEQKDQFSITGNIPGLGTGEILLKYEYLNTVVYKDTKMENGMFTFHGTLERPSYARIYTQDKNFDYGLFLENTEMQITGIIKNSGSWVKVMGSATDDEHRAFKNSSLALNNEAKALRKQEFELGKTDAIAAAKKSVELDSLLDQIKLKKLDFIKSHPKSHVSLFEIANKENDFDGKEMSAAFSNLDVSLRESLIGKRVATMIEAKVKTESK